MLGYFISTLCLARPRCHHHRLYFAYSDNRGATSASSRSPFYTTTVVDTSSAGPLHSATWLCALPCTSGIGNTARAFVPDALLSLANPVLALADGIILTLSSTHHRLRLQRFRATIVWCPLAHQRLHVRLPRPRLPYARHPRPWLFTLVSATSTSAQRAIIHMRLRQFCSNHSIHTALRLCLWGDVNPLVPIFGFFSSLIICSAPTVTVGEY